MTARVGVITFPGSLDDRDAARAVRLADAEPVPLWHAATDLSEVDAVILPGGFSYGDYLRAGAIARFAPLMERLADAARGGMPVLGICNGFQVLCESHLLPGALTRNASLHFVCRAQRLRIENAKTDWTRAYEEGQEVVIPVKNIDGCFIADPETLEELESSGRVVARYVDVNPNGSLNDIAGICNEAGNVVGLMPHPEHAVESLTGPSSEGLGFFVSVVQRMVSA
ncbi:phosphoribosylformylglycinamidine synthase subunit PurQ [Actinoallomurus iriomotensis]|jgi:phosphoribosylformylglycinamidine synthase subunit PurQ / glutaminase|uniref:Phosphoribosylformylglycinamidine synthase subunit PurQ n=1 Tax=Actinoallomurus iriomotensis TaxID=478107 RepID=A0A9W6W4F4_9ACTN|nr:phosphoribosylformylglycinamidine synthase subunit PurQ [Actinoallomurus iriomotensis]GLY78682.1 phosphoribosylformylglycinamidine synthase subunit PurQ [Actinoallomurus iriomotensis]GLY90965.1 phosphoribosylformylglycinamidine synthase subunit PurQ [Actinoallomurus iriomotensis]